jgi:hypothetical protein
MNSQNTPKPTTAEVAPLVRRYYAKPGNACGGSLHIVLADGNVSDAHIKSCIRFAEESGDADGVTLGQLLLRMTKTQRLKLYHMPRS